MSSTTAALVREWWGVDADAPNNIPTPTVTLPSGTKATIRPITDEDVQEVRKILLTPITHEGYLTTYRRVQEGTR